MTFDRLGILQLRVVRVGWCVAACIAPAWAASDPLTPPDLERYLRWGPLRARPGISLTDFGYDSNVLNTANGPSDFRATIAPRLEGLVRFGDAAFLTFTEEIRYTAYQSFSELNYFDQLGTARLTFPLRKAGLYTEGQYDRVREQPVDFDDARPLRKLERLRFGAIFRSGWRTTIDVSHEFRDFTYTDDDYPNPDLTIGETLDRRENATRVEARMGIGGRSTASLEAAAFDIEFDTPSLDGDPGLTRNADGWRVQPGLTLGEGGRLTGTVRAGPARLDYRSDELLDFSGWVGDADLRYRPASRLALRLRGFRQVGFAVSEGNNYYLNGEIRLIATYWLRRWLALEPELADGSLTIPGTTRDDALQEWKLGARIRLFENDLGRRTEYVVRYGKSRRDSNFDIYDRSRTILNFNVNLGF